MVIAWKKIQYETSKTIFLQKRIFISPFQTRVLFQYPLKMTTFMESIETGHGVKRVDVNYKQKQHLVF